MEKLGVIGGMGAEATSYYYDQVVRHTAAACDQEHIDMVVLSKSTMPDRTLLHTFYKIFDNFEVNICLQKSHLNFTQSRFYIIFCKSSLAS